MSTAPTESDRAPAPGPLRLVQEFVNTLDADEGRDLLADRETFSAWLQAQGIAAADPLSGDIAAARELREALRALLCVNAGADPDPDAAALVNDMSSRAPVRVELGPDGAATLQGGGVVAAVLAAAGTAMLDGSWTRLKACLDPGCGWAFYDRSRNRSGQWCDTACGSRHKVRAYRARQRHTPTQ
ncbi:MAG TPA: CGNR zinc finger domain-containing protein [Gaiellales bacterium]|nr:CGNR zinc finger domain-containing protein [Gaiellales bacterium]